jgi:hypothetical protein
MIYAATMTTGFDVVMTCEGGKLLERLEPNGRCLGMMEDVMC